MIFDAYYNPNRFFFLEGNKSTSVSFNYRGGEVLRKTACFFSEGFNVFIDSSDGVNEDFPIKEYCGRIKVITANFKKPFLYFKCNYSKEKSSDIELIANENGGKVLPFFMWNLKSQNPKFYTDLLPNRKALIKQSKSTKKDFDILYAAGLGKQLYPKPNLADNKVAWSDYKNFGLGSPKSTGYFEVETRKNIAKKLSSLSSLKFKRIEKIEYNRYISESFRYKLQFSPPGLGEYSCRMFNSAALGQAPLLRKSTYDFYDSWKDYIPEVDLKSKTLEEDLLKIIEEYEVWGEKALFYFENSLRAERLVEVFEKEIIKFRDTI